MGDWVEPYVQVLRRGGVVACPTETVVGLLADALSEDAVARVVQLKRRAAGEPIGLLLPDVAAVERVTEQLPAAARRLAERHWPGPLTLVVRARTELPAPLVRDGRVGVRVPGASPALELVRRFGGPLTATSANRSGQAPAMSADEVRAAFGDELDAIVEGRAPGRAPSTVVDFGVTPPRVLREGPIDVRGELAEF